MTPFLHRDYFGISLISNIKIMTMDTPKVIIGNKWKLWESQEKSERERTKIFKHIFLKNRINIWIQLRLKQFWFVTIILIVFSLEYKDAMP